MRAFKALNMKFGESLFIAGASGAIGTILIQLAVNQGITVVTSASLKNHNYMKDLGASKTVDYNDIDWPDQINYWFPNGVDAVIAIQPNTMVKSSYVLKNGGRIISVSGDQISPNDEFLIIEYPYNEPITREFRDLIKKVSNKEIKIIIEKEYLFKDALDALNKVSTRHVRGKTVIII